MGEMSKNNLKLIGIRLENPIIDYFFQDLSNIYIDHFIDQSLASTEPLTKNLTDSVGEKTKLGS